MAKPLTLHRYQWKKPSRVFTRCYSLYGPEVPMELPSNLTREPWFVLVKTALQPLRWLHGDVTLQLVLGEEL